MKVDFKPSATLVLTPENQIENYALKKWFKGYTSPDTSEEILTVNLFTEDDTNSAQHSQDEITS